MFSTNWWQSKNDPWITNDSLVNAAFCWILWFIMSIAGLLIVILGPLSIVSETIKYSFRMAMKPIKDFFTQYFLGKDEW